LEAAGIDIAFLCHGHAASDTAAHCADGSCHSIEGATFSTAVLGKLISGPQLVLIGLLPEPTVVVSTAILPERSAVPRDLCRRWQFHHRTAPPARAPSALA
jgi:hypothetical protein